MTDTRTHSAQARVICLTDARASLPGGKAAAKSEIKVQALSSTSVTRPGAANDTSATNPCLSCGACCAHFRVSFYCGEIAGESGGTVPAELVTQVSPLRGCMKGTEYGGQRCVALRGELGQDGIHCSIYEQRPSPCREFPAWLDDGTPNPDCQRVRMAIGLPPLSPRTDDDNDDDLHPTTTPPRRDDVAA